jgi:putative spermidine/putrescine transport system permease protein/spermidine/putrescine transport system permease protein
MTDRTALGSWLDRGFVILFAAYVLIPLGITALMAFSNDNIIRFPIRGYSLRWFEEFFNNRQWLSAAVNSLKIAAMTSVLSVVLAVPAAYGLARSRRMRSRLLPLLLLPLFVPAVVLGVSIAMSFGNVTVFGYNLFGSPLLVACAHALWALPLAITVLEPSFKTLDLSLIEAAGDLGASPARTFFTVSLPLISTGLVSAALFAFITSLNEFIMALFLTTRDSQTLPVLLWLSLRSSASPQLAVAAILLVATVFSAIGLGYLWYFLWRRRSRTLAPAV